MMLFQAYLPLLIFLSLTPTSILAIPKYAKTGCNDTCGNNVTIPYPFGIGADCSVNKWYIVDCNSTKPYLSALNVEVLSVNLEDLTVTVIMPRFSNCLQTNMIMQPKRRLMSNAYRPRYMRIWETMSVDLGRTPFLFSKLHNKFVYEGCGSASIRHNTSRISGCSASCGNDALSDGNSCFGFHCCQTAVPYHLKSYNINFFRYDRQREAGREAGREDGWEDRGCGSAFLVDRTSFDQRKFSVGNTSLIPTSLLWTLADSDQVTCCYNRTRFRRKVDMFNSTPVDTWQCDGWSTKGTPYLIDGCDNQEVPSEECRRCKDNGGFCDQETTYYVDGSVFTQNVTCKYNYYSIGKGKSRKTSLGVILGVSISMGVLFLVVMSYGLFKVIKKTKERRLRKRCFKRNGGLLLKQQEETDPSLVDKTILFTSRELEKATDNFNENRILGRGGQGTVYKGMLVDGRIVAVKKSKIVDESQLEQFINEVVILSQINHRNVVKLLGCCLETNVPLLVSEFIPNGTLHDLIHNTTHEFPFSLNMRLQIATEVAGAIAYLHSAASIPIYHRDIKTTNILLDDKYRAKVSDFGTSRCVSIEQTHFTTALKGTVGYFDPEYLQSNQFTEKSDVYSFGVVLVELLTGEKAISRTRFGETTSLVTYFMSAMEEKRVMSVFDAMHVIKEGTRAELLKVADLAMRCLNLNGKYRPTMKEVAIELETIRTSHIPSTVPGKVMCEDELSMRTYDESSSTLMSFNDSISSDAKTQSTI